MGAQHLVSEKKFDDLTRTRRLFQVHETILEKLCNVVYVLVEVAVSYL